MSKSFGCKCEERQKPVEDRAWEVWQYKCNYSSFNKGGYATSDYSTVYCTKCLDVGRTKASYVDKLKRREF